MSRIVSGQLRLLEESSILQAAHMGMVFDSGKNPPAPKSAEQHQPNLKKDVSQRGKGDGLKGIVQGVEKLIHSTFVDSFAHFSVGFEMIKEDAKDLDKTRDIIQKWGRTIIHPKRMGKKDESGMSLPTNKQNNPPKEKSSLIKSNGKINKSLTVKPAHTFLEMYGLKNPTDIVFGTD